MRNVIGVLVGSAMTLGGYNFHPRLWLIVAVGSFVTFINFKKAVDYITG